MNKYKRKSTQQLVVMKVIIDVLVQMAIWMVIVLNVYRGTWIEWTVMTWTAFVLIPMSIVAACLGKRRNRIAFYGTMLLSLIVIVSLVHIVLPSPFVVAILFTPLSIAIATHACKLQKVVSDDERCIKCGYLLYGISSKRCPECGAYR